MAGSGSPTRDHDPLEQLNALFVALGDLYVDSQGVTSTEFREIRPQILFLDFL